MKTIPLTRGYVAMVDDDDCDMLMAMGSWRIRKKQSGNLYAQINCMSPSGRRTTKMMHTVVMGASGIDHADGNGLNNQKTNLRIATAQQNNRNRSKKSETTSKYRGVYRRNGERWVAQIGIDGKNYKLGNYVNEKDAAISYNIAAFLVFGKFSRLNVIS